MKKKIFLIFTIVALSFSLFAQERIVLKIASVAPARSPWDVELRKLAAEWQRITNGEVILRFHDMTTLGGEKAGIQKLKSPRPGQKAPIDGAIFSSMGLNELSQEARIFTLSIPFLIRSQNELDVVIKKFGPEIENSYSKLGYKLLAWTNAGWITFYTQPEFKSLNELKQIKIACSGFDSPVLSNCLKIAGFNVEDIPSSKLQQSLKSRSGVQGFFSVPMLAYVTGMHRDVSHGLGLRLCPVMAGFVMSSEAWARIPEKYKPAMQQALDRTIKKLNAALDDFDVEYTKKLEDSGVKIFRPTSAQENEWNRELIQDMRKAAVAYPEAVSEERYEKILKLLESYRK